jgi:excisionase family DNA binding protein
MTCTIRAWIREGRLTAGRTGRHYKIKRSDLVALIHRDVKENSNRDIRKMAASVIAADRQKT